EPAGRARRGRPFQPTGACADPMNDSDIVREIADRQAIAQVLTLYSRGIDRCDLETLTSTFWPDGTAKYGAEAQNAHEWAAATVAALKTMHRTYHSLSNMLIEVDGET